MNVGTIVEADTLKVRLGRVRMLGEIEESFVQGLRPGDTLMFAGRLLTFQGIRARFVPAVSGASSDAEVPVSCGGRSGTPREGYGCRRTCTSLGSRCS